MPAATAALIESQQPNIGMRTVKSETSMRCSDRPYFSHGQELIQPSLRDSSAFSEDYPALDSAKDILDRNAFWPAESSAGLLSHIPVGTPRNLRVLARFFHPFTKTQYFLQRIIPKLL